MQIWDLLAQHPILGVAGSRLAFAPQRLPWWRQTAATRVSGTVSTGAWSHIRYRPAWPPRGRHQVIIRRCTDRPDPAGRPGRSPSGGDSSLGSRDPYAGAVLHEEIASWWNESFGRHFYDMAFTFNASCAFQESGLKSACYAMVA